MYIGFLSFFIIAVSWLETLCQVIYSSLSFIQRPRFYVHFFVLLLITRSLFLSVPLIFTQQNTVILSMVFFEFGYRDSRLKRREPSPSCTIVQYRFSSAFSCLREKISPVDVDVWWVSIYRHCLHLC